MTSYRYGLAAALGLAVATLSLLAGRAGTQSGGAGKVLPVLSTTDGIGYVTPCG